jgi:hypothetical protein
LCQIFFFLPSFLPCLYWGLNSRPSPWALFLWRVFQDKVSQNYLPGFALNCSPHDLCLQSSYTGVLFKFIFSQPLVFFSMVENKVPTACYRAVSEPKFSHLYLQVEK